MAFWKKFYKSKYTGAEIDAAVKAGNDLSITKKMYPKNPNDTLILGLQYDPEDNKFYDAYLFDYFTAPKSLNNKLNTAISSMAMALAGDTKYHKTTITGSSSDEDFEEIFEFLFSINTTDKIVCVNMANVSEVNVKGCYLGAAMGYIVNNYIDISGMGLGEIIYILPHITDPETTEYSITVYARKCDVAT